MSVPCKPDQIDLNDISLGKPKILKNRKIVKISYKGGRFLIQTPELYYDNDISIQNGICEMNIPICCVNKKDTNSLMDFWIKFNKFIIDSGTVNSINWFGESSQIKFKSVIRKAINPSELNRNGVFKLKMKENDKSVKITRNRQRQKITTDQIPKSCLLKSVIEPCVIWIDNVNNTFGVHIRPVLLDFRDEPKDVEFLDDSDSDSEYMNDILETEMETSYDSRRPIQEDIKLDDPDSNLNGLIIKEQPKEDSSESPEQNDEDQQNEDQQNEEGHFKKEQQCDDQSDNESLSSSGDSEEVQNQENKMSESVSEEIPKHGTSEDIDNLSNMLSDISSKLISSINNEGVNVKSSEDMSDID